MSKKINAILLCVFAIFALSFSLKANAVPPKANLMPSDYDTGVTLQEALKQNKPIVANFYVDWCGYCRRFAPILEKLKSEYKDTFTFVFVNCDDLQNEQYIRDYYISGYPSLYLINPENNNRVFVPQGIYAEPTLLKKEFNRFLNVNKVIPVQK